MIREERLLKLFSLHTSLKKSTVNAEEQHIVFRVAIDATKAEIKAAVAKLFEVEVDSVRTLVKQRQN